MEEHPKYQAGQETEAEPKRWPTTDELVAMAHANRQGEEYPTPERLLENLPVVRRALCDHVLSGEADVFHTAYAIASLIEVIKHVRDAPSTSQSPSH